MGQCSLRQIQTFECTVCHQNSDYGATVEARFLTKVFGLADRYQHCCCCGQFAPEPDSLSYRRRWDRWAHRLVRERLAELRKMGYGFNKEQTLRKAHHERPASSSPGPESQLASRQRHEC